MNSEAPPKIVTMPASGNHAANDMLTLAAKKDLKEAVVIGRYETGELFIDSSRGLTVAQVNWYLDLLKLNGLGLLR